MAGTFRTTRRWLIVGLSLFLFGPGLWRFARLSVDEWRLTHRLRCLEAAEERLLAERERLQQDPVYVEGLIRTTFKHAKPGELVLPLDPSSDRR